MAREPQKVYLSPPARDVLRDQARNRRMEMSQLVEHLLMHGEYPPEGEYEKTSDNAKN